MNKTIKKNFYNFFVIILLGISIIYSLTIFSFFNVFDNKDSTFVGTIIMSNIDEEQYANVIASSVLSWEKDSTYKIEYQDITMDINLDYFKVNIPETISHMEKNKTNTLFFDIDDANTSLLKSNFVKTFSLRIFNMIDFNLFLQDVHKDIGKMNIYKIYDLKDYLPSSAKKSDLNFALLTNIEENDVDTIISEINEIEIKGNQGFSLLKSLSINNLTNNQLSIIASGIEKVTLNSHLTAYIFEQNSNSLNWIDIGANVKILKVNKYDFSLYNNFDYSLYIEIKKESDNSLSFTLQGYPYASIYESTCTDLGNIDYKTIYEDDQTINASTPNIIVEETDTEYIYTLLTQTGVEGKIYKIERTVTYPNLQVVKKTLFYETYNPISQVYHENIVDKGDN